MTLKKTFKRVIRHGLSVRTEGSLNTEERDSGRWYEHHAVKVISVSRHQHRTKQFSDVLTHMLSHPHFHSNQGNKKHDITP